MTDDRSTSLARATAFPLTSGRTRGYHPSAVDAFLRAARKSFEASDGAVTAADIRNASFPLVKHGYSIGEVDAALGRVEDAFAVREREAAVRRVGVRAWVDGARTDAQVILDHLGRPKRKKFARTGMFAFGYRVQEVDHVARRIVQYLRDGDMLSAEQVRSAAFRMQRRGYREEQVDALLDATVAVILAVR